MGDVELKIGKCYCSKILNIEYKVVALPAAYDQSLETAVISIVSDPNKNLTSILSPVQFEEYPQWAGCYEIPLDVAKVISIDPS